MNDNQPKVAFGRYPCCNAVRPIAIPAEENIAIHEHCPACGTRVSRMFNGFIHVISVREGPRSYRNDTRPVFKTGQMKVKASPAPVG